MFKIQSRHNVFLTIPLTLSIFTHLWFAADFPPPAYDEGEYMRRAVNLLIGSGPQESVLYDHPYFGPLLLAGILRMIDYPYLLNPSADRINSNIINANKKKNVAVVLLSGICLGLAIFSKIPIFTMISLNSSTSGDSALLPRQHTVK